MAEIERLIAGINPKARHFVDFLTTTNILFPIRPRQVNATERNQEACRMRPAFVCQPRINSVHVFGEERLETPCPGLNDPVLLELCDEGLRVAVLQHSERPVEEIYVCVDDSNRFGRSSCGL